MRLRVILALTVVLAIATAGTAFAQTNVVTNGSFETSAVTLTGWTYGSSSNDGGTGTCGFNAAAAPGTETLTSTAGFPAMHGSNIALGSNTQTSGHWSCVLYQDVTIPAGAATATLSGYWGRKLNGGKAGINAGLLGGLYATTKVPAYGDAALVFSGLTIYLPNTSDSTLVAFNKSSINVSSLAGQTVRLALIIVSDSNVGNAVAGFDDVQLNVTIPTYTVTYNGNGFTGGSVPVDAGTYTNGQSVTVRANTGSLVRAGYTFNGWNAAANGSGNAYPATGAATFNMGSSNVTLYAQWTAVPVPTMGGFAYLLLGLALAGGALMLLRRAGSNTAGVAC